MQINKLRAAIRLTAAVAVLGVAGQSQALTLDVGDSTKATLYGYARLNMSYDLDDNRAVSTRAGSFTPSANPDSEGHFGADVQQSRFGVKVEHETGASITIEGDFRGSGSGPGSLRMRHAYGEYKGFMAGRNWSNYLSFIGNTATLDFDSLAGTAGGQDRAEQIRYTIGALSFALEDPASQITRFGSLDAQGGMKIADAPGRTSAPAFTARYEDKAGQLSYATAVVANQVTVDDGENDDSVIGFAGFVAGRFELTDVFSVQGALNISEGANGYLWRSGSNYYGPSAYLDGDSLETIGGYGGSIGASLKVGGGNSVNIGYGYTELDLDDALDAGGASAGDAESNQNMILNYLWIPVENVMFGVEYGYLKQETVGGDSADANRVIFAAQYTF